MTKKSIPTTEEKVSLVVFADRGFSFRVEDENDLLPGHITALTVSTHALMRVMRLIEQSELVAEDEESILFGQAREGIEFLTGMTAQLAERLAP